MCVGSIGAGSEELKIRRASIVQFTAALPPPLRRLPSCPTVYYAWQGTRQGVIALILEVYDVSSSAAAVRCRSPPPAGLLLLFFQTKQKDGRYTTTKFYYRIRDHQKRNSKKCATGARLVQALLSSKNGPIDSCPTATSLWYLSASPFLYVCCLSLSIHNVHLWLFALAARDDQRIGFLFAALSSARR